MLKIVIELVRVYLVVEAFLSILKVFDFFLQYCEKQAKSINNNQSLEILFKSELSYFSVC